jgi:flagellum-specific ATP synthase
MYQQNRDLIAIGAYQRGSDPRIDAAINGWPQMQSFLQQDMHEQFGLTPSINQLQQLVKTLGEQRPATS